MKWIILGYLTLLSWQDIMKKAVPLWYLITGMIAAAGISIWQSVTQSAEILPFIIGLIPGICFLGIAKISREQVGYGDGLALLPLGMLLGFEKTFAMVLWSLLFASVCSLILIVLFRYRRGMELPFMPFLLAGYVMMGGAG